MATRTPGSDATPASPLGPELGSGSRLVPESTPSRTRQQSYPIVFTDHTEKRFVFPFESCETYSAFKSLLERIYARASEDIRNKIQEEKYDLLTSNDEVILPAVWEYVVKNHLRLQENHGSNSYTIKISFWPTTPRSRDIPIPASKNARETRFTRDGRDADPFEELPPPRPIEVRASRSRSRSPLRRVRLQSGSRSRSPSVRSVRSRSRSPPYRFVRRRTGSHSSTRSYYLNESADNSETATSDSDTEAVPPPHTLPPPRAVNRPLDREGNRLSCLVDTKWPDLHHGPVQDPDQDESEETEKSRVYREMKSESPLRILKALQISSENRMAIQIHTLSGPENPLLASSVGVRWYHLSPASNEHLDFTQFKATCLGVHGLTSRMKRLITKTLEKVEKEKVQAFLDGMFIEPGTVLRGDELNQDDPESVIFSCVPYFEAQAPVKLSSGKADRYHPPRSLMQSYYPYEPVRERDMEQAFKRFKTGSSNRIIHVPAIWVMNIDRYAVVTCGYHTLKSEFIKSIIVIPEEPKMLNPASNASVPNGKVTTESNFPNLRLTDWEGRILLYTLDECRTYFEIEQRLRELRYFARGPSPDKLELVWASIDGLKRVTPLNWLRITKRRADLMFIDLCILDEEKKRNLVDEDESPTLRNNVDSTTRSIPPFFQWVHAEKANEKADTNTSPTTTQQYGFIPTETKRSMHCLEVVEKAMLSAVMPDYEAETIVDRSFTSVTYYQSLPEETLEHVRDVFVSLLQSTANRGKGTPNRGMHQIIVDEQCTKLGENAATMVDIVHDTLKLFVSDVDKSTMLRKLWGGMLQMAKTVKEAQNRACSPDPEEFTNEQWRSPLTGSRTWFIRSPRTSVQKGRFTRLPEDDTLRESIKSCQACRHKHAYSDPSEAMEHLRTHLQAGPRSQAFDASAKARVQEPTLQDWIRNDAQLLVEETNAGFLVILTQAIDDARRLLVESKELAEGVKNPEGKISDLYTFPHELLKTLRKLITYYLIVERSVYYTEEAAFQSKTPIRKKLELPYDNVGLGVMRRYFENARTSLLAARKDLCNMARSKDMHDIGKRLSLSPEYICSWFIRKLLVKPIDNSMTVADLYREYLSTLQFQVNHHPGKRLLRSINLLQEELAALEQVNSWQTNFIQNYLTVLDDSTYQVDKVYRRALFPYERVLLSSCLDTLNDAREDFGEMIARCGPLSESTKQSAEINEEDHGKAILVFTVVTIIFLPLSFVTSYLGMNTSDIRDMDQKQSLFWTIALPLTALTMGSILFIAYNGDELRGRVSGFYRRLTGKQDTSANARGISVAQRKRASKLPSDSSSTVDYRSLADEAEYAPPRPVWDKPRHFQEQQYNEYMKVEAQSRTYTQPTTRAYAEPAPAETYSYAPAAFDTYRSSGTRLGSYRAPLKRSEPRMYSAPGPPPPPGGYSAPGPPLPPGLSANLAPPPPALLPNSDFDNLLDASAPTYIRIAKKYLDVDTLAHYDLPWEYDIQDPDYFIIFKALEQWDTDAMFEHTKMLREREKSGKRDSERHRTKSGRREKEYSGTRPERKDYRDEDDDWYGPRGPPPVRSRSRDRGGFRRTSTFDRGYR